MEVSKEDEGQHHSVRIIFKGFLRDLKIALTSRLRAATKRSQASTPVSHMRMLDHADGVEAHAAPIDHIDPSQTDYVVTNELQTPLEQTSTDLLYRMSDQYPFENYVPQSSDSLVLSIPAAADRQAEENARALEEWKESVRRDGVFRKIHVRYDNDPENRRAQTKCVLHDTGASRSLTFVSTLRDLGMGFQPLKDGPTLTSVTGEEFSVIGTKQIQFSYQGKPDNVLWALLYVLRDPTPKKRPNFDILFGRDFITKENILVWNKAIIGVVSVQPDPEISLAPGNYIVIHTESPRSSLITEASEAYRSHPAAEEQTAPREQVRRSFTPLRMTETSFEVTGRNP